RARPHPRPTLFPYTTLFRSAPGSMVRLSGSPYAGYSAIDGTVHFDQVLPGSYLFEATTPLHDAIEATAERTVVTVQPDTLIEAQDRKSTRLNSSHQIISYAV